MMDSAGDEDDPRWMEMETLEAIFPEMRKISRDAASAASAAHKQSDASRFAFELELPVVPTEPVTVLFPAASTSGMADQQPALANGVNPVNGMVAQPTDSLLVSHLPPLSLKVVLPDGYPSDQPPGVTISTTPQWLSSTVLSKMEDDGPRLWEEAGRDMIVYDYIDHIQREAETVFGAVSADGTLEVDPQHKLAVLDFDINAKKAAFEKETFECGICLDPKKGSKCHKMLDCGHVFCLQCLQDFYSDAIEEGSLSTVRCLTPNCAKERATADGDSSRRRKAKAKTFVSPSELLQIGLSADMVKRYVTLKYKTELEADKDTVYCPRQWCNGAARSKKHKKPEGFELAEASDEEGGALSGDETEVPKDEGGGAEKKPKKRFDPADLLCVCEDCSFAFCSRCLQTWHGEFIRCTPKRNKDELTEEEKASLEYLQLHTSPCPTCNAPAQKTHGCNHMICSRCDTHFCYLCSSWLDPTNPYKHFNQQDDGKVTSCYMRLWELEGGDGDDVGLGFIGGQHGPPNGNIVNNIEEDEVEWLEDDDEEEPRPQAPAQPNANAPPGPAVAREAPLVLRLMDVPAPRQGAPPEPAAGARGGRGGAQPRGRGHGRGARGGDAGRGAGRGNQPAGRGQGRGGAAAGRGGPRGGVQRGRGAGGGRAAAAPRGGRAAANQPARQDQREAELADVINGADLNPAQEDWVRRFVQMALMDAEDQVEGGDSDSDDDNWRIR